MKSVGYHASAYVDTFVNIGQGLIVRHMGCRTAAGGSRLSLKDRLQRLAASFSHAHLLWAATLWLGGREAESAPLIPGYTGNRVVGSNPTPIREACFGRDGQAGFLHFSVATRNAVAGCRGDGLRHR